MKNAGSTRWRVAWVALMAALVGGPGPLAGQDLADFDYENLSFRGVAFEVGHIFPTRVEGTTSFGIRTDLGFLGPGLRIVPGISYWSSDMKRDEVRELEVKVEDLIVRQGGAPTQVNLGRIEWSDVVFSLDGHVVWSIPYGFLSYAGVGVSAHILNGAGDAIEDTFVEDLLDSVTAGFNAHGGLEYPINERFRVYGTARGELLGDLQYFELRIGGQVMFGPSAPGELR